MKIHQRTCKNNFLDDKNKLLDEVSESNNIVTTATENNMNKISIAPFEEYENTMNMAYKHMVCWRKKISSAFH